MSKEIIFKICDHVLLQSLLTQGNIEGSEHDQRDGFVHFSTAAQLLGTFDKYFAEALAQGQRLWLLFCDTTLMSATALRFEESRNAELFPHLYAPLNLAHVGLIQPLRTRADLEKASALTLALNLKTAVDHSSLAIAVRQTRVE